MKKVVISPAQALLILLKNTDDPQQRERLKRLYLSGAKDDGSRQEIEKLIQDERLGQYTIKSDPDTINNDPSRRYFETHLAYESLQSGLSNASKNDMTRLSNHSLTLYKAFSANLKDAVTKKFPNELEKRKSRSQEYLELLEKIKNDSQRITQKLIELRERLSSGSLSQSSFEGMAKELDEFLHDYEKIRKIMQKNNFNPNDYKELIDAGIMNDNVMAADLIIRFKDMSLKNNGERLEAQVRVLQNLADFYSKQGEKLIGKVRENEQKIQSLKNAVKDTNKEVKSVKKVLDGSVSESDDLLYREFGTIIHRLKTNDLFNDFGNEHKTTIFRIILANVVATAYARQGHYNSMPIDIYGSEQLYTAERGKITKKDNDTSESHNLGLLKSWMPVPKEDVARSSNSPGHIRASDQANFDITKKWPQQNFEQQVHPHSNSISGSMLCQLRAIAWLGNKESHQQYSYANTTPLLTDAKDPTLALENYLRLYISALLYATGGHSTHEYFQPLQLEQITEYFQAELGIDLKNISMESMFIDHNQNAFEKALLKSIEYNDAVLQRQNLHAELKSKPPHEWLKSSADKLTITTTEDLHRGEIKSRKL